MARSGIACGNWRATRTLNKELTMSTATLDRTALETKVKSLYSDVAANPHGEYRLISERARKATATWGVKSVSILARKL